MTNPAVIACGIAMLFYGLEIAVADWKLQAIHPRVLTLCYSLGVAMCALIGLFFTSEPTWPTRAEWPFVGIMVGVSFIAALAHFAAITGRAGAVTLTLAYSMLPVVAAVFSAVVKGEWPTWRHVVAWFLGIAALLLIASGATNPSEG